MPETNKELIEALAKIERQLLWLRDDYKKKPKSNSLSNIVLFIYSCAGAFTIGVCHSTSFLQTVCVAALWPVFLGFRVGALITKLIG